MDYYVIMRYLGLDVGLKRTGVAFADSEDDILFSLETISHSSMEELLSTVRTLATERNIDEVVVGLPLLPSGKKGAQAQIVLKFAEALQEAKILHSLLDERYTSTSQKDLDKDAVAACQILAVKLQKKSDIC